ncbi:xylosidase/arabinosidase [Polyplosphaeria fusca]|uniref:Xylosidase/arabinosidase n=1 Tax=Polyplosphaeria fusca TaxID=682080 RepID=A0A9P4R5P6_9PLEO|nr:xylosidase/arabinosidase [Polyplosphaeria fusca]
MRLQILASLLLYLDCSQADTLTNPALPGFHPDPTCIFVAELNNTFFCTTSTINWFPSLPIYASRDLVHWKLVTHAISRPEQLPIWNYNNRGSSGIYAPTLRYRDGTFIITCTHASQALPDANLTKWDNFILQTKDIYGEWDDPVHYYAPGIDPSPFWDDDGVAWITSTFNGSGVVHAPVNLTTGEVTLPYRWLWIGSGFVTPEAAHVYKKDGWYYTLLAQGGTRERHQVTMARSRNFLGPYEGAPNNPLLTAYNNTKSYFQAVGHVDLFQDAQDQWWAFEWPEGEFPIFTNVSGTITGDFKLPQPSGPETVPAEGNGQLVDADDDFDFAPGSQIPTHFLHWRPPITKNYRVSLEGHKNSLALRSSMLNLTGFDGDSTNGRGQTMITRRQSHTIFKFSAEIDWSALSRDSEETGITLFQDQSQHFEIGVIYRSSLEPRNLTAGSLYLLPPNDFGPIALTTGPLPAGPAKPYIRFGGIGITQYRLREQDTWIEKLTEMPEEWIGLKLRFQIEAVNTTHYSFSAGAAGRSDEGLRTFGYTEGRFIVPIFSGATVGAYATSSGRYGEGAFESYISRWKYTGIRQVIDQPDS